MTQKTDGEIQEKLAKFNVTMAEEEVAKLKQSGASKSELHKAEIKVEKALDALLDNVTVGVRILHPKTCFHINNYRRVAITVTTSRTTLKRVRFLIFLRVIMTKRKVFHVKKLEREKEQQNS